MTRVDACRAGLVQVMFAALAAGAATAQDTVPLPPEPPVVTVTGPSVIAFWTVPASDSVLEADPGLASALDDHQYWWSHAREQLEAQGLAALDQAGLQFEVQEPARRWSFAADPDSAAVGFLFIAPGGIPHVEYGRRFPDEVLAVVRQRFGNLRQ